MSREVTTGYKLALTIRPFLSRGTDNEAIDAIGSYIDGRYRDAVNLLKEMDKVGIVSEISIHKFNAFMNRARMVLADLKEISGDKGQYQYPEVKAETEYQRVHILFNELGTLIPVELRAKAAEILDGHLSNFNIEYTSGS